jgi:hypothetical protein
VTNTATKKPKRTPEEIVRALLDKTLENGCTKGEEAAAVAKAEELILKHGLERSAFKFPPKREDKRKRKREGRTIRDFCEELLSRKPPLSYDDILAQVRAEFAVSKTTVKCLRYYASKMRSAGQAVPARPRASAEVKAAA